MSRLFVQGMGAVTPAGWGRNALRAALDAEAELPWAPLARPGRAVPLRVRPVPTPDPRPSFLIHPRVRRAAAITHYALAAALEALELAAPCPRKNGMRLGIILCLMSGSVTYSRRFFAEVLEDPRTASPLLFPETVLNATASHLAALLETDAETLTLVGDDGTFLMGLATAALWLETGKVDGCVVIGAEDMDWLIADAARLFSRNRITSAGAGAIYLTAKPGASVRVEVTSITSPHLFWDRTSRRQATERMRAELPEGDSDSLLITGTQGIAGDADEELAWRTWKGPRMAPKAVLGDAFPASAAWHTVIACDALALGRAQQAVVSVAGTNQQTIGICFSGLP
ncbi:MAG: hypothetical protein H6827_09265 [Planctomycetes bacterium]|nr:hypothetical protein [Planctomycetota bacterium]